MDEGWSIVLSPSQPKTLSGYTHMHIHIYIYIHTRAVALKIDPLKFIKCSGVALKFLSRPSSENCCPKIDPLKIQQATTPEKWHFWENLTKSSPEGL